MNWVLMYHSVTVERADPYNITVHPAVFERQMGWLRSRNLRGIGISELLAKPDDGLVGLTFDDGYADFATTVVPILRRFGFTATAYVLPECFGGSNSWDAGGPEKPLMTREQVRQVAHAGMEVGSHGLRHVSLPTLTDSELAGEIEHSRALLTQLLQRPINGFAYPYGNLAERELKAVAAAGYQHACVAGRADTHSPHAIPRSFIGQRDSAVRMAAKRFRHERIWR